MTSTTLDVDNQNLRLPTAIVGMFVSRILVDIVVFAAEQSEQFQLAELDPSLFVVDNFPERFRVSATQRGMVLMLTDQMTSRRSDHGRVRTVMNAWKCCDTAVANLARVMLPPPFPFSPRVTVGILAIQDICPYPGHFTKGNG